MIHITKDIILTKNNLFGRGGIGGQGACFVLCCIIALICLCINTAVAGIIFLFGTVVLIIGNKSDDKMWNKQEKLGRELATELNSWLIPLIEENTYTNASEVLNKIQPILEQNAEKLSKAKQIFKELQNTDHMMYLQWQSFSKNKEMVAILQMIV